MEWEEAFAIPSQILSYKYSVDGVRKKTFYLSLNGFHHMSGAGME